MVFGRRGKGLRACLGDDLLRLVTHFMEKEGLASIEEAVKELVRRGYEHWVLESRYGSNIDSRAAWDIRFRLMKVEAGYAHYRWKLREAVEELRRMTIEMSGLLAQLRMCYRELRECGRSGGDPEVIKAREEKLKHYMDEYIRSFRADIEDGERRYVSDAELVREIENLLRLYKDMIISKQSPRSPPKKPR